LITHELPSLFGEFASETGYRDNPLSGRDDLWSELVHLARDVVEQIQALDVLSTGTEYTALLEAIRLFDERFREPGCQVFSRQPGTVLKILFGQDGYLAMRAGDTSAFTASVRNHRAGDPEGFAQAVSEFIDGIALAEEQRAREAEKEQEALRDVLKKLNGLAVSLPVQKHVESARPAAPPESQDAEQQAGRPASPPDPDSDQMLWGEHCLPLKEAAEELNRIDGGKRGHSTLWRWATEGRGGIHLETRKLGGKLVTSREALERFTKRLSEQADDPPPPPLVSTPTPSPPKPLSSKAQTAADEQERQYLDEEGI
jgi:hypothetical protein